MKIHSTLRTSGLFGCVLFLACLVMHGRPAQAVLLAYDPFAYGGNPALGQYALGNEDAGTNVLGGQNPLIGPTPFYNGGWIQSGGDSQVVKALPSLSYPSFPAGQGGIQQETVQFACCSFGRSAREIAGGLGFGGARTIYQSFLIDFGSQGTDDPTTFGKRGHELWNGGVGDSFLAVEIFLNHFGGVNVLTLAVTTASGTTSVPVAGGGTLQQLTGTHLIVMKYQFNPANLINPLVTAADDDIVSLYLDPSLLAEPGLPSAQVSVNASDLLITHQGAYTQFTFSGSGHVPGAIDEIRWGDTYFDVTTPEPTSVAILALGGLVFLKRQRN